MSEALPPIIEHLIDQVPEHEGYPRPHELRTNLENLETKYRDDPDICAEFREHVDSMGRFFEVFVIELTDADPDAGVLYIKDDVHSNEHVAKGTMDHLAPRVLEEPKFMVQLGLRQIIYYDAESESAERNGDQVYQGPLTTELFLQGSHRSMTNIDYSYHLGSQAPPGTMASMKIMEFYQPTVFFPGHCAALNEGAYWLMSHDIPLLNEWLIALSDHEGIPRTSYGNTAAVLADGIFARRSSAEGKMSHEYLKKVAGLTALAALSEGPYLLSQASEADTPPGQRLDQLGHMEDLVSIYQTVRDTIACDDLAPETQPHYDAVAGWLAEVEPYLAGVTNKPIAELPQLDASLRQMLYFAVPLNSARQVAELSNKPKLARRANDKIIEIAQAVDEGLQPIGLRPRQLIALQVGTIAAAALAQKQGLITAENNVVL
ncbi:MAG TPA: hypothetical protein VK694_06670 [Verrucomicrobiae bacterium]|nr:hypothetical protein [Verrucomicrobiae bacterium]